MARPPTHALNHPSEHKTLAGDPGITHMNGAPGPLCLLLTSLIIRVGGKLVCQVFFGGKWLGGWRLVGFWRVEGVDRKTRGRGEGRPGAKARLIPRPIIRGAEAPLSLRRQEQQQVQRPQVSEARPGAPGEDPYKTTADQMQEQKQRREFGGRKG